jgi:hypothetical protein
MEIIIAIIVIGLAAALYFNFRKKETEATEAVAEYKVETPVVAEPAPVVEAVVEAPAKAPRKPRAAPAKKPAVKKAPAKAKAKAPAKKAVVRTTARSKKV